MIPSRFQRWSYLFLCAGPFLAVALAAPRPLRVPGVYQVIGILVFALFAVALWVLSGRALRGEEPAMKLAAVTGMLLLFPFALIALFWVGLGPPWEANASQNLMRYVVLVTASAV